MGLLSLLRSRVSTRASHLDVVTSERLKGNQLAVFLESQGLTAEEMMAITPSFTEGMESWISFGLGRCWPTPGARPV